MLPEKIRQLFVQTGCTPSVQLLKHSFYEF